MERPPGPVVIPDPFSGQARLRQNDTSHTPESFHTASIPWDTSMDGIGARAFSLFGPLSEATADGRPPARPQAVALCASYQGLTALLRKLHQAARCQASVPSGRFRPSAPSEMTQARQPRTRSALRNSAFAVVLNLFPTQGIPELAKRLARTGCCPWCSARQSPRFPRGPRFVPLSLGRAVKKSARSGPLARRADRRLRREMPLLGFSSPATGLGVTQRARDLMHRSVSGARGAHTGSLDGHPPHAQPQIVANPANESLFRAICHAQVA
jgi:hypothetical protein